MNSFMLEEGREEGVKGEHFSFSFSLSLTLYVAWRKNRCINKKGASHMIFSCKSQIKNHEGLHHLITTTYSLNQISNIKFEN